MKLRTSVLDHGYVEFIEDWGVGRAGVPEAGIIEAARQSTQASFRSWAPYELCEICGGWRLTTDSHDGVRDLGELLHSLRGDTSVMYGDPTCEHRFKQFPRGDEGLLSFLFNSKPQHGSVFEFAGLVIEIQAPIFVFREWMRHRTASYNEMSARYAPLPPFDYVPDAKNLVARADVARTTKNRQAAGVAGDDVILTPDMAEEDLALLRQHYAETEQLYQRFLSRGWPKEMARVPMPVGRYSRMRASANLRNWLAFLTLRSDPAAQWEIRQFADVVGKIISWRMPRTWRLFDLARAA